MKPRGPKRHLRYAGAAVFVFGSVFGVAAVASGASSKSAGLVGTGPGTPAINMGTVFPTLDNGGMGAFNSIPLPGPRSAAVPMPASP